MPTRKHCFVAIGLVLLVARASDLKAQDKARIDLKGDKTAIKAGASDTGAKITQKSQNVIYCEQAVTAGKWEKFALTFTPEADGKVDVMLRGEFQANGVQLWIDYDKLELAGATIVNGDFEQKADPANVPAGWQFKSWGKSKVVRGKDESHPPHSGEAYVVVSHVNCIWQTLDVKKDQAVTLTVYARLSASDAQDAQDAASGEKKDEKKMQATKPKSYPGKLVRILLIGNSYSQNASEYLPALVESQGNSLVLGHAEIGGCSLEKHWTLAQKFEANPSDFQGKPYSKRSLRELLESDTWDIVTLQQHSWLSRDLKTYRPFAANLAAYIRKYAPQAKILVHETWAYRTDDMGLLKKTHTTQEQMYQALHDAYQVIAKEIEADRIIPTGTAFQNARQDPRWKLEVPDNVDPSAYKYPDLPVQKHSLVLGWAWSKKGKATPQLIYDPKHCNAAGKYLAAVVWYETIYGDLTRKPFVPPKLSAEDAALMREIAHKTVREGLKPKPSAEKPKE
ncbi:MAG TPA: DUF4886 domain-containing protein [Phycisphaerae bacterium]|nr:DUF4886 domain-containing protein [Phycisphaerae bacterium]